MNETFYPTPTKLINKMLSKVKNASHFDRVLEPSAGKGDIVKRIIDKWGSKVSCIEIDEEFQDILRGQDYKVIDSNFLSYSGIDQFDLIIGNPPFNDGCNHLLKAIDILYSGEIVFLLNAETLKNPYTNKRKDLVNRLDSLNANIEYIQDTFIDAERKTGVEIALIHIIKDKEIEEILFDNCKDTLKVDNIFIEDNKELASNNSVEFLVDNYNTTIDEGRELIKYYYQHSGRLSNFLQLKTTNDKESDRHDDNFKAEVNESLNCFIEGVRHSYWKEVLKLEDVKKRMTSKKEKEFYYIIEQQTTMDFTENNIRSFILKLIGNYENILTEAVTDIFDEMTIKHNWNDEFSKNVHYFNGWKTNKSFYVNKKVILPVRGYIYGSNPFLDWNGKWKLGYEAKGYLQDIDKVMNYFSGLSKYISIRDALETSFIQGKSKSIESTYFTISVYKKGTIHLTFKDESIRRRFNIVACKHKKWLPEDYGTKVYEKMRDEEKNIVKSFEGKEFYNKHINCIGFIKKDLKEIEYLK